MNLSAALSIWLILFLAVIAVALYLLVTGVRGFVRGFRDGLRGVDAQRTTLRRMLFTTMLVTLLVPFLLVTALYNHNSSEQDFQSSRAMSQLQEAIGIGAIKPGPAAQSSAGERSAQERDRPLPGRSGYFRLRDSQEVHASGLPASAVSSLRKQGWATGTARFLSSESTYTAWRVSKNGVVYYYGTPQPWWANVLQYGFTLVFGLVILSPFAAVAAWLLNRRIVKPVQQVSEASVVLADGGEPMQVPTKAPLELAALATSFNRMAQRLRRAQDTEREFLLSVGHELKTPLTAIDGYAELLADGAVEPKPAAEVLGMESARLRRLIGDLLDLARIDRSEFTVLDEPLDLADTTRQVEERYHLMAASLGVGLRLDVGRRRPRAATQGASCRSHPISSRTPSA